MSRRDPIEQILRLSAETQRAYISAMESGDPELGRQLRECGRAVSVALSRALKSANEAQTPEVLS